VIRPHYVPLYQGICHSEKMADLREKDARFFFCALLTYCDAYGRMDARPRTLHSKVWAMFGTPESVPKLLADLERVGLIVRYEHEGQPILAIPDWEEKAGKVGRADRRGESSYPPPPARGTTPAESVVNDSSCQTTPASRARLDPSLSDPSLSDPSLSEPSLSEPSQEKPVEDEPRRIRSKPTGDHAECIQHWEAEWTRTRMGTKYPIQSKDAVAIAWMLKQEGPQEVRRRITAILEDQDAWTVERASVGLLRARWAQYGFSVVKPPKRLTGMAAIDAMSRLADL